METSKPIDPHSILSKTTLGLLQAKGGDHGDLNYDAVRLLRLVDGTTSIAELRASFEDLTDTRYEKAVALLARKGLIRILPPYANSAGKSAVTSEFEERVSEVAQECLQTLDFTKLKRELMEAMRTQDLKSTIAPKAAAARETQPPHAAQQKSGTRTQGRHDAKARAEIAAALKPKIEAELRAELMGVLRPKVEEELRHQLVAALRPVLEAEIRNKLIALKTRGDQELRALSEKHAASVTAAAAASEIISHQRLLERIDVAVFQIDADATTVYVNRAWTRLSGHGSEFAVGKPFARFFATPDQRGIESYLNGMVRGKTMPSVLEANLAHKAGYPVRVTMHAAPLAATAGDNVGVCGTLREADKPRQSSPSAISGC